MIVFFQLMGLTVPTLLPLVLPLALGVGVIFVYNKLAMDSELVVMRSIGISPWRLAKPALTLSILVMITCFTLTLWLAPIANRNLVALQYQVRDSYAVFLAHPGNFNDITDGLTFYARRRGGGGALEGILIHDVRQPTTPITIMADTGRVIDNNGQPQIVVFNGRRQEMDVSTGRLSEIAFDQYVLDFNALRNASVKRLADPREQSVEELLNPSNDMLNIKANHDILMAELHQRLATPLLALSYTLVGLSAILAGEFNRRGMGKRLILASLAIIMIEALIMSLNSIIARHGWMAFALYLTALIPGLFGFLMLNVGNYSKDVWHPETLKKVSS
jgi:lipopolysaccharide export system permease protein